MEESLGGLRGEKYREPVPELQLEGGGPLYHALLENTLVVAPYDREQARDRFNRLAEFDPAAVAECEGKSAEEAKEILLAVEERMKTA